MTRPAFDHPLRRLENATLSPHLGYVTEDNMRVFYEDTAEALLAWLEGASGTLRLAIGDATHEVERIGSAGVARQLGFRQIPTPA